MAPLTPPHGTPLQPPSSSWRFRPSMAMGSHVTTDILTKGFASHWLWAVQASQLVACTSRPGFKLNFFGISFVHKQHPHAALTSSTALNAIHTYAPKKRH